MNYVISFGRKGYLIFFDEGIFGCPNSKWEIIIRELNVGNIKFPAIFLGDSKYDGDVAIANSLDFIYKRLG